METESLTRPEAPAAPRPESPARAPEPTTARALWPTFLRRTLAEEEILSPEAASQRR